MAYVNTLHRWCWPGKITKAFTTKFKKTHAAQVTALQKATQKAFDELAAEIDAKNPAAGAGDGEKTQLTFKINKQEGVITGFEIQEGYELQLDRVLAIALKTPAHIYASNLNEFAWVSCDLVSE